MWYKKIENKKGRYVDAKEVRYMVVECYKAQAPNGKKNADLGLTEFKNMEECLKAWELKLYVEPKKEEDVKVEEPKIEEVVIPKKRLEPKKKINLLLEQLPDLKVTKK